MPQVRVTYWITDRFVSALRDRRMRNGWQTERAAALPVDAPPALTTDTDLTSYVKPIDELASEIGEVGATGRLWVPATWVYAHRITLPTRRLDPAAAAFEFEGFVPLPLEALTCTFRPVGPAEWLGLAVAHKPLAELFSALEQEGIAIDAVHAAPLAFVAGQSESKGPALHIWIDHAHTVVLSRDRGGRVQALRVIRREGRASLSADDLATDLALLPLADDDQQPNVVISGLDAGAHRARLLSQFESQGRNAGSLELVTTSCNDMQSTGPGFRVGALRFAGRWTRFIRQITQTAAMLAIFLILLALALHRERTTVERAVDTLTQAEQAIFSELFPGRPAPPGIGLRVASERIRLEGLTRTVDTSADTNRELISSDVPAALRNVIAALPDDVRLFVQDLHVDASRLTLRGTAASHTEAERIATAVRGVDSFAPTPPRSDGLRDGGVSFSFHAERMVHGVSAANHP